tara:strand:- start:1503 stop:4799 length:3297 start_codon:yes stop_codon:yes gene_type:complete
MRIKILLSFLLAIVSTVAIAQQRAITGVVLDDTGIPLPGATVIVEDTNRGVTTDFDGNFSIEASTGEILVVSFVGYEDTNITVGEADNYSISLALGNELDEVVVTSLGIKREAKALGYAIQTVGSDDIANSGSNNALDALVGKASGVQITRSAGSAGGGSRILIRGVTSMIGNNQPLIVIDGIITNNETLNSGSNTAGTATSNRLMDLNNDDIESINILKGSAATALYGTAGAPGVIVITTKKGEEGEMRVSYTHSTGVDWLSSTFDLQNEFAQGRNRSRSDRTPYWRSPGTGESASYGPAITDLEYATDPNHPEAPAASHFDSEGNYLYDKNGFLVSRGTGNGIPGNNYQDNYRGFFREAMQSLNNLSIQGGTEKATYAFSTSFLTNEGIVPNEEYGRKTFRLAGTLQASDKLKISTTFNYVRSDYQRIQQGSNTSGLMLGLYRTPVSFDNANGFSTEDAVDEPSAYQFPNGLQRSYRGNGGYDNPYWLINNALRNETVNRVYGSFTADWNYSKWLNASLIIGADFTSDSRKQNFEKGSATRSTGYVSLTQYNSFLTDAILNISGGDAITDKLNLNYLVSANAFDRTRSSINSNGSNFAFLGFINLANASNVAGSESFLRTTQMGFVGQVEMDWDSTFYLTLAARQDYDSRLGVPGREFNAGDFSFVYPAASVSILLSELLPKSDILSFAKIRASWAQVGGPPPFAYLTSSGYSITNVGDGWGDSLNWPINGVTGFEIDSILGNSDLTSELTEEIEFGIDFRFFNNRIGLDLAYYERQMTDAILNASLPPSTGYNNVWLNSGRMSGRGIEATLNLGIVESENFSWNSQINFTSNENIVEELAPGLDKLFLAGFSSGGSYLIAGNQYGALVGGAYLRSGNGGPNDDGLNVPDGDVVINDNSSSNEYGFQAVDPVQRAIGDPNPDFILGWNNQIRLGPVNVGFLFDWREGGDMLNGVAWALSFFGRSQLTADTRTEAPAPIAGVLPDGSPNNIPVVRDQYYYQSSVGGFGSVWEQFTDDAGWIRLREVSLGYNIPLSSIGIDFIDSANLSVVGRNLWYSTDYNGVDPETSLTGVGNGQGVDYFNMPGTRSVLAKLKLNL